jgi:hypothetical protein
LLLSIGQMPVGWTKTDEALDEKPAVRLFKREQGDGLYAYAQVFADTEAAADSYQTRVNEISQDRAVEAVDVEGAGGAVLYEADDEVWVQFRERNARGAVRRYASVISHEDVINFAELQAEHY